MKVTKFVHSCLLVETPTNTVLIDPGGFSYDSHLFNVHKLNRLDYIVITHEHPDHYNENFLRHLSRAFRQAIIVTNEDLAKKIAKLKLPNKIQVGSDDNIVVFDSTHEPITFNRPVPKQIGVHIADQLTCPGDSIHVKYSRKIVALPITAPWLSHKQALESLVKTNAEVVVPVHDWFWHKKAREYMYNQSRELLEPRGIKFVELENAEPTEIK